MNGAKFPTGCAGAVWSDGSVSKSYCENKGGRFPWWGKCCKYYVRNFITTSVRGCIPKHLDA